MEMKAHTTQPTQVSELFSITERNVADSCFAHAAIIDHVKWQQPRNTVYFFHEVPEILLAVFLERIRSSWTTGLPSRARERTSVCDCESHCEGHWLTPRPRLNNKSGPWFRSIRPTLFAGPTATGSIEDKPASTLGWDRIIPIQTWAWGAIRNQITGDDVLSATSSASSTAQAHK